MNASVPNSRQQVRLAVVQYGDYVEAVRMVRTGGKEPYAGMRHSVEALEDLFSGMPHLVISLNAPPSREVIDEGLLLGIPLPRPRLWRRSFLNQRLWSRQVCEALDSFRPTHLLMRANGQLALKVLELSTRRGWSTLALFANNFASQDWLGRRVERQLTKYLNHPSVLWVGNHRKISAQSLVEHGVRAEKVIAYDWPPARHPSQHSPKALDRTKPIELLFAANMIVAKGLGDLIAALGILRRKGINVRLTAMGVGKDHERLKELANSIAPDAVTFPGQVDNDLLFEKMRQCTLMCVVTRPEFPEGGSLALTEALSSRTPAVLSDQVMFKKSFVDGEGIRFFRGGDPISLSQVIEGMVSDEVAYAKLSETTHAAFDRVECQTTFAALIAKWKATILSRSADTPAGTDD